LHSWILVHVFCGHALLYSFSMQCIRTGHITVGLGSFQFAICLFSRCRRIVNINRVSYVFSVQSSAVSRFCSCRSLQHLLMRFVWASFAWVVCPRHEYLSHALSPCASTRAHALSM
jgi:hypothetical protein